jgi:hypothetical protein
MITENASRDSIARLSGQWELMGDTLDAVFNVAMLLGRNEVCTELILLSHMSYRVSLQLQNVAQAYDLVRGYELCEFEFKEIEIGLRSIVALADLNDWAKQTLIW